MRKEAELELKEWQEKRDALQEQKKKGQLKPFYAGSRNLEPVNKTGPNQQKQATQAKGKATTLINLNVCFVHNLYRKKNN